MSRKIIRQILPAAEPQYSQAQMNQLIGTLQNLIDEIRNPLTNISGMPGSASTNTLQVGDLYQENGFVRIIVPGTGYTGTNLAIGLVGSVTVVTT